MSGVTDIICLIVEFTANSGTAVALHTLGCKLNQAETELLAHQLGEAGYLVTAGEKVDICILNTCTVTHVADRKARHWLRLMRRKNPEALVIATGCYAERAPDELKRIGGVDVVVGNKEKGQLPEIIQARAPLKSGPAGVKATLTNGRVRTLVKVQDGCNDFCTYCIVPRVRGKEYSLPPEQIIKEINDRVVSGYREIVLTGTKIGSYQYDSVSLRDLIETILKKTSADRLRLSSLLPDEVSPEVLSLWQDRRLCPHFHLALQSGSDSVLKRMGRRYSVADFRRVVALIRQRIPDAAITTDVMVGFPGETEAEFDDTYRFCQELAFARIHVFSFSPRPNTAAARLPEPVAEEVKKERAEKMLELSHISAQIFARQFLGQNREVLWEKEISPGSGIYSGLTDNYLRVFARSQEPLTNKLLPAYLTEFREDGVWGRIDRNKRR